MDSVVLILVFYAVGLAIGWYAGPWNRWRTCSAIVKIKHPNTLSHLFPGIVLPHAAQQQSIYNLIRRAYPILENRGIKTWMVGGTLLGAVRCKPPGIIPWDDDIDLGYDDRQTEQLRQLDFEAEDLVLTETWFGFKVHPIGTNPQVAPFIDLFPTTFLSDGTTEFARSAARVIWTPEKESFRGTEMLFPLRKYRFGKTYLKGPQNPQPYLTRKFGSDWQDRAVIDPPHLPGFCGNFRRRIKRQTINLSKEQRASAIDLGE